MCQFNPAADLRDILPKQEIRHFPALKPERVPQLLQSIYNYKGDKFTIAAMRLIALTFVRTSELIKARWPEINFAKEEWHIPKERMKNRKPHMVPLSRQALAIFKELYEITGDKEYVFFSSRAPRTKHISNNTVLSALYRMGYNA